ncbi:nuclear transport factor 2 family protein [Bergeyella sp. RCAD1439]|uniref:nuclear transport factor 2 family protein n=1 Tax=Bergeyella anatis TaxID=3113737 RepID=UPI002E19BDE1|nr:nuclear transport factor 2 family protein [Bergeyella sp. RCAD1439]
MALFKIGWLWVWLVVCFSGRLWGQALPEDTVKDEKKRIEALLDDLNRYSGAADFEGYFALFSEELVFIGTDAGEVWDKDAFKAYAHPHFAKGKAWQFIPLERHVYLGGDSGYAWFDELLDTAMGLCRGSGVVEKTASGWRIRQYVLSLTVPNEAVKAVKEHKASGENYLLERLRKREEIKKMKNSRK